MTSSRDRESHMIISGNIDTDITKGGIVQLRNDKLTTNITESDIKYVLKLNRNDTNPKRVKFVFLDIDKKAEVMKKRKVLKGKKVWLSDDLTPHRSSLAFHAREAVKQKKIAQTWVIDNKVFIKMESNSRPQRITAQKDLPE